MRSGYLCSRTLPLRMLHANYSPEGHFFLEICDLTDLFQFYIHSFSLSFWHAHGNISIATKPQVNALFYLELSSKCKHVFICLRVSYLRVVTSEY